MKRLGIAFGLLAALACAPVAACVTIESDTPPTLESEVADVDVILVGYVVGVIEVEKAAKGDPMRPRFAVMFVTRDVIKGQPQEADTLYLGDNSCSAAQPRVGVTYLIAANVDPRSGRDVIIRNDTLTRMYPKPEEIARIKAAVEANRHPQGTRK